MFVSFASQTLELLPATQTTDHGNVVWTHPATGTLLTGCVVNPVQSREDNINRAATITQYAVQAPTRHTIGDNDRIRYRGKVYQIIGEVQYQSSPTGSMDQLVFTMEVWNG